MSAAWQHNSLVPSTPLKFSKAFMMNTVVFLRKQEQPLHRIMHWEFVEIQTQNRSRGGEPPALERKWLSRKESKSLQNHKTTRTAVLQVQSMDHQHPHQWGPHSNANSQASARPLESETDVWLNNLCLHKSSGWLMNAQVWEPPI